MKSSLQTLAIGLLAALSLYGCSTSKSSGPTGATLQVKWVFKGIEEGYDHNTKGILSIDNETLYTTEVALQSKPQSFSVSVPKGNHKLKLVLLAEHEGTWEEHIKANDYAIDCMVEQAFDFTKAKHTLEVVFDLDKDTSFKFK
jgi:hypothetical protein